MPIATMKDKGQITVPAEVRRAIAAGRGDLFEVRAVNGAIVMTPQRIIPAEGSTARKKVDLSKYIGIAKGTYGSADEIDAYIRNERASWDS